MNNHAPRVSIGLPVYNGERYLKETLDCILAQTFEDFELVISDNASTDETQAICQAYGAQDRRIRYYCNDQNLGAAWNYNRVFELSNGGYFKWAAHDDLFAPEFLERCVEVLDRYPSVILCYPKASVMDEFGKRIGDDPVDLDLRSPRPDQRYAAYHKRFRMHRNCNPIFGLMRASTLKLTSLIGSYVASDEVLLGELALRGEFYEIPEYLFSRRDHAQTSVRAYPRFGDRVAWFDPARKSGIHLAYWRWFFEQLAAIQRVPMRWHDKIRCHAQLGKWALWRRGKLYNELSIAVEHVLQPLPAPLKRSIKFVLHYSWTIVRLVARALRASMSILKWN